MQLRTMEAAVKPREAEAAAQLARATERTGKLEMRMQGMAGQMSRMEMQGATMQGENDHEIKAGQECDEAADERNGTDEPAEGICRI